MSNAITNKTMVLITHIGPFWVTEERGTSAMKIKEMDPNASIEMDGSYIAANQIRGLLTAQQYAEYQYERRGMWQCNYQKWHPRNDICYCAREVKNQPPKPEPKPMTDEERERASKKLAEIREQLAKRKAVK